MSLTRLSVSSLPRGIHLGLLISFALAVGLWFLAGGVARADRFGPPWQSRISVDQTVVYSRPDRTSTPVGPLPRGAIVVVFHEAEGADGAKWTEIPDGYLLSVDLEELREPWIAEIAVPSASVYAKPFTASGVRRTARAGDLLRVTGVSPALEGDTGWWWSTTDGYLRPGTIRTATGDQARGWTLPDPAAAEGGWWGAIRSSANVRAGSSTESAVVGQFAGGERVKVLAEEEGQDVRGNSTWYRIDGGRYAGAWVHSSLVRRIAEPRPTVVQPARGGQDGPWMVVNRATSVLTLVRDGQPVFATYVSLGKTGVATPAGTYSILGKFRADDMSSTTVKDPTGPYDLPNVPFTQYYLDGGYAIHGTYWHDGFGTPGSQGCINLSWADAAYLFSQTKPTVPQDENERWESADPPATRVVIVN